MTLCLFSTPTIEEEIEHVIDAASVDTSESLGFFPIVCHVATSVSFFSDYLEFLSEFLQTFVSFSNVISLEVFDVRPPRKPIYLNFVFVEVLPSELVELHLPEIHNETRK